MRWLAMAALLLLLVPSARAADARIDTVKVVTTGEFYPYGNTTFHAPYVCTMVGDLGFINGVQVLPGLTRSLPPTVSKPIPPAKQARFALVERVGVLVDSLLAHGTPEVAVAESAATLYRADTAVVDSVHAGLNNSIAIWWKGEPYPSFGTLGARNHGAPNLALERRQTLNAYATVLATGGVLVLGDGGFAFTGQPDQRPQIQADIERASHMTIEVFTARVWHGAVLPADAAREFANPMRLQ